MANFSELLQSARGSERYWLSRVKFDLAAQLQDLLKQSGLTQEKYAQELGVKAPQVSRTLSGSSNPTLETVTRMAFALGFVPHVTFKRINAAAKPLESKVTESLDGLEVEVTRLGKLSAEHYRFEPPRIDVHRERWTVTNDERFDLAA